jgi:hypothetical protein
MIVPLVQPSKNVEDKVAVGDGVAKVGQGVGHALHLAIVDAHWEVVLDKVAKRSVEVKCAHFIVVDELVLNRKLDLARGDVMLLGNVLKLANDRAENPGEDDDLHALPGRIIDGRSIREDVVGEFIVL